MEIKGELLLQQDYAFVVNLLGQRNTLIAELQKEIETLRLDNTYLQQRLKREVEK